MSKIAQISLIMEEVVKSILFYLAVLVLVIFLVFCIYIRQNTEAERITNLEIQLQNQMNCIDDLVSDVDNLKEYHDVEILKGDSYE
ncbi:MAG: hypothetical protein HFH31_03170 [Bacilli bacterium]|nr:hypothetical protein [Bacilli bacterium]